jgi:hypothetical protein
MNIPNWNELIKNSILLIYRDLRKNKFLFDMGRVAYLYFNIIVFIFIRITSFSKSDKSKIYNKQ